MIRIVPLLFFILAVFLRPLSAETIYMKPAEALKIIFQNSQEITSEKKVLTPEQKVSLGKKLGRSLEKDSWNFYVAKSGPNQIDGFAVIDNEIGKTDPITFLTAIHPDGSIKAVEILVYRESYGSEVKEKKFLKQYENKTAVDPIRTGQDISSISGATLSSRAISVGVKRDLMLWDIFYGKK